MLKTFLIKGCYLRIRPLGNSPRSFILCHSHRKPRGCAYVSAVLLSITDSAPAAIYFLRCCLCSYPSPYHPPVGGRGVVLDDYFFYLFLNVLRTLRRIEQQLKSIEGAKFALTKIILFIKFHEMNIMSANGNFQSVNPPARPEAVATPRPKSSAPHVFSSKLP